MFIPRLIYRIKYGALYESFTEKSNPYIFNAIKISLSLYS